MQLPYSILLASLALAVTAVPVESAELLVLTPDNFDKSIAHGVWLIEHFSPYCRHCQKFAPTWTRLVEENEKALDPGIRLAQVNCAVHGDLCSRNKVDGYPQINLYRNGVFLETFQQSRDFDILTQYIASHAEPTTVHTTVHETVHEVAAPSATFTSEDDYHEPLDHLFDTPRALNPLGSVLSLDETNFRRTVDEGKVFVKFFAPWCGHCKKLAPTWSTLAGQMRDKLDIAEVNCEEHGSICRAEGVTGYPMLKYYGGKDSETTEYTGGRKLEQLKVFAEKASNPAVQELLYDDLSQRASELPVLYLLLRPRTNTVVLDRVIRASRGLLGNPPLYVSSSPAFFEHFAVPSDSAVIVALKDGDYNKPAAAYPISSVPDPKHLETWMMKNRLPTSMELDADSFQEVMNAKHEPLVVIVATPKENMTANAQKVKDIARQWTDSKGDAGVVFTWMDVDKWASWLKGMYDMPADGLPRVVIADHARLVYYDTDQFGEKIQLTPISVFSALDGVLKHAITPKHSENIVERLARYLNNKLIAIETYVTKNPWSTLALFGLIILVVVWTFKRLILDETQPSDYGFEPMRKADRLD